MNTLLAVAIVVGGVVVVNLVARALRNRRRAQAAALPDGEAAIRRVDGVSLRLFVDRTLPGGPKAGGVSNAQCTLVLTAQRFLISSDWGRVVEIRADLPGEIRWTGPGRVVVEASHPSGRARARAELLLKDGDAWLDALTACPGATVQKAPTR